MNNSSNVDEKAYGRALRDASALVCEKIKLDCCVRRPVTEGRKRLYLKSRCIGVVCGVCEAGPH